jgi:hypothetical protein
MAQQKQTQQDQEREHQEDALAIAQNGGVSSSDEGDMDDSEDMDDDMMDRISSSPSIEDGRCQRSFPVACWPRRVSSLPTFLADRSLPRRTLCSAEGLAPRPLPTPMAGHHHLLRDERPGNDPSTERGEHLYDEPTGWAIERSKSGRTSQLSDYVGSGIQG